MAKITKEAALEYHESGRPGKIEVKPTKAYRTQTDLSLAYSPGVAYPCLEIQDDPNAAYKYTDKGNLVAVISNGTAVLGLGDIGAMSGKPVMEGKGLLFKIYGGIDVFDIEVAEKDPEKFCEAVERIAPTFGGINLEDIKAPECFVIENELKKKLDIPVFHDDQHGTAIVVASALINALRVVKKDMDSIRVVVNGAGAAGQAITRLLVSLGVQDILLCDTKGAIYEGRPEGMNPFKDDIARITNRQMRKGQLADVLKGADVFVGVSVAGCVTEDMVRSMAADPIIMAMANPTPEIMPELAHAAGARIVCTGRSDYPNQVNNLLAFPGIFRGALDVRAKEINEEMKLAAAYAIAGLISEKELDPDHVITSPFDPRVAPAVAKAVAKAAMETGVARRHDMTPTDVAAHTRALLAGQDRKQQASA
jgi:malate dehydrogenase (oxaloacetate-decarboxylating)